MTNIELAIKISEDIYKARQHWVANPKRMVDEVDMAIANGTPLPKEYGRLIDADEVVKKICIEYKVNSIYELPDKLRSFVEKYLNEAPTILKPTQEYMIKNYAFSKSKE